MQSLILIAIATCFANSDWMQVDGKYLTGGAAVAILKGRDLM